MTMLRQALFVLALIAGYAQAQTAPAPGEIAFWESVRDSKNPDELRAYLQAFPNGMFAPIARTRLTALERAAPAPSAPRPAAPASQAPRPPAAVSSSAPGSVTAATRMPQAGDTWTYRLTFPHQFGQRSEAPRTHVVRVGATDKGKITDVLSVDGGTPIETSQSPDLYLVPQGASIFSPYLHVFRDLPQRGSIGRVTILEPACGGRYACEASARAIGYETVNVPAGAFNAVKVQVSHNWRSSGSVSGGAFVGGMMGGRILTVWYVPELKRAVKFQSRLTVGDIPPVDSNFDLELVSYQVK